MILVEGRVSCPSRGLLKHGQPWTCQGKCWRCSFINLAINYVIIPAFPTSMNNPGHVRYAIIIALVFNYFLMAGFPSSPLTIGDEFHQAYSQWMIFFHGRFGVHTLTELNDVLDTQSPVEAGSGFISMKSIPISTLQDILGFQEPWMF